MNYNSPRNIEISEIFMCISEICLQCSSMNCRYFDRFPAVTITRLYLSLRNFTHCSLKIRIFPGVAVRFADDVQEMYQMYNRSKPNRTNPLIDPFVKSTFSLPLSSWFSKATYVFGEGKSLFFYSIDGEVSLCKYNHIFFSRVNNQIVSNVFVCCK